MLLKDNADILAPPTQQTFDEKGRLITPYTLDRNINCDIQPLKYNAMYQPAGITDKTSNVMFCKDAGITALNRIRHNDVVYIINSILPYRNHTEVYLEKVI